MRRYGYKKSDIIQVIHLLDTDGRLYPKAVLSRAALTEYDMKITV